MADRRVPSYRFGEFRLDPVKRVLLRGGDPVPLTPKVFDTLLALVRRSGRVIAKDELLSEIWPDTFVEEGNLAQNIFILRKTLGQDGKTKPFIETIPKHGYRFIAEVEELSNDGSSMVVEELIRTHIVTEELPNEGHYTAHAKVVAENMRGGKSDRTQIPKSSLRLILGSRLSAFSRLSNFARKHVKAVGLVLLSCLILAAILVTRLSRSGNEQSLSKSLARLQNMRITKLTNTGKAVRSVISPDGKYIAYAQMDGMLESLWLRQVPAINNIEVVPPACVSYVGLTFSQDSSALYYVIYEQGAHTGAVYIGALYQVPVLGGTPRKIISDIDSNVTFSPDGKRLAFSRYEPKDKVGELIVADVNGTGEKKLATLSHGELIGSGPAWSPDGKIIICPVRMGSPIHRNVTLTAVRVDNGAEESVTNRQWKSIGQVTWLADGSGLVMDAWDESVSFLSRQIWHISYPSGEARLIINDLNSYEGLSVTTDAKALVTALSDRVANFWIAPSGDVSKATQITSGSGDRYGETMGISWTPDGRIVYGSLADDKISVWIMNADGNNRKQLTANPDINFKPAVSPDGRSIVFVSRRTGSPHLWKMNIDGNNLKQLTNGNTETFPDISPDGRWIAYTLIDNSVPTVWKVAIDGGESIRLTDKDASDPSISPDGKLIACYYKESLESYRKIAIIPFGGGAPIKTESLTF